MAHFEGFFPLPPMGLAGVPFDVKFAPCRLPICAVLGLQRYVLFLRKQLLLLPFLQCGGREGLFRGGGGGSVEGLEETGRGGGV